MIKPSEARTERSAVSAPRLWYVKNIFSWLLFPFSLLYRFIIFIRHFLYQIHILKTQHVPVPVIVVGNITVGGTGKTPLVIALVNALKKQGWRPGIISRGYRGNSKTWPQIVNANSDPALVGDEAVLMARGTAVPVVVGPKRVVDAKKCVALGCNILVSDDGLQHYGLHRDIEIAVMDGERGFGNGFCLPAGPLREPISRLKKVDFVVVNGGEIPPVAALPTPFVKGGDKLSSAAVLSTSFSKGGDKLPSAAVLSTSFSKGGDKLPSAAVLSTSFCKKGEYKMHFMIDDVVSMTHGSSLSEIEAKNIIAVAGIGNPGRFFNSLERFLLDQERYQEARSIKSGRALSLSFPLVKTTIFPDHHAFKRSDFDFAKPDDIIIMTEKDAVKCATFADDRFYVARGQAVVDPQFFSVVLKQLQTFF